MGTRPGDLDLVISCLHAGDGWTMEQYEDMILNKSELKGLCESNDVRGILIRMNEGDLKSKRALAIYFYRIRKYIGTYMALNGPINSPIFNGGVGENFEWVRKSSIQGFE